MECWHVPLLWRLYLGTPANAEEQQRRESVHEDRRDLVKRMEDKRVSPGWDGESQRARCMCIVDDDECLTLWQKKHLRAKRDMSDLVYQTIGSPSVPLYLPEA